MAPTALGRRGERRGFAGRPGGRPSGRPWPLRGGVVWRRPAWKAGDREPAAAGPATRGRMPRRGVKGFAGRPGGRTSGRPWPQRGCGPRRGLWPLRAKRVNQGHLPLLGSPNRKVREYAPLFRTLSAFPRRTPRAPRALLRRHVQPAAAACGGAGFFTAARRRRCGRRSPRRCSGPCTRRDRRRRWRRRRRGPAGARRPGRRCRESGPHRS